jgi:hypothetical protein
MTVHMYGCRDTWLFQHRSTSACSPKRFLTSRCERLRHTHRHYRHCDTVMAADVGLSRFFCWRAIFEVLSP